ncbi:hypothetical protein MMC28_010633 [Mycoblastus sanguinarius]|nr:hypothetical protein [Mycoblastus sanguinarius]
MSNIPSQVQSDSQKGFNSFSVGPSMEYGTGMSPTSPSKGEHLDSDFSHMVDPDELPTLCLQRAVLQRLKAWHQWEQDSHRSLVDTLLRTPPAFIPRPSLPTEEELLSLAEYYFPLRDDLEVTVCDFDAPTDGFCGIKRYNSRLGSLEQYLRGKPIPVLFRWIHVPVGAGWLNSAIKHDFEQAAPESGISAKTLDFKVLSLRDSDIVQDQLDVFNLLQDVPGSLQQNLQKPWGSKTTSSNIKGGENNFWRAAASDMPGSLAQIFMADPNRIQRGQTSKNFLSTVQCLGRHPDFKDLMLTTDNMTCVCRSDGVLLTMLSSKGLNYLNRSRKRIPWPNLMLSPDEFVLGSLATSPWPQSDVATRYLKVPMQELSHNQYVELLLLDIVLGFHTTPLVTALEKVGLEEAYEQIVSELNNRGLSRLRRRESVVLVQNYVACMNEISNLSKVVENKKHFLRNLVHNFPTFDAASGQESDAEKVDVLGRTQLIESQLNSQNEGFEKLPLLLEELKSSLDVFFKLKTIEQNEVALLAESNNQAILVFTIVTIIFLPLSFFTSYFGMNLKGVVDTNKNERYFWTLCGSTTALILLLTLLFGFRKHLRDVLWSDQTFTRSSNWVRQTGH